MTVPPFIIYALPRSRTAWLAAFLSYGGWTCLHEHAIRIRSISEARALLATPRIGFAETAAGPGWRLLRHWAPDHRAVVVRRPHREIVRAMIEAGKRANVEYDEPRLCKGMEYGVRCLDAIAAQPASLVVDYAELGTEDTCRHIFEFCLHLPFDHDWWLSLRDRKVEVDLAAFFRFAHAEREGIDAFKRVCKNELMRLGRSGAIRRHAHI
jgi:hypothetical protein